jgi:hypothetical protein
MAAGDSGFKKFMEALGGGIEGHPIKITVLLLGLIVVGIVIYWVATNWQAIKALGANVVAGATIVLWGAVASALTGLAILAISFGYKKWKAANEANKKAADDATKEAADTRNSEIEAANKITDPTAKQAAIDAANSKYADAVKQVNTTKDAADATNTTVTKGLMDSITTAVTASPGTPDAKLNVEANGEVVSGDAKTVTDQTQNQDITASSTGDNPLTAEGDPDISYDIR